LPVDLSSERRGGSERGGEASERIRAVEKWLTTCDLTTELFEPFCSSARELEVPASRRLELESELASRQIALLRLPRLLHLNSRGIGLVGYSSPAL